MLRPIGQARRADSSYAGELAHRYEGPFLIVIDVLQDDGNGVADASDNTVATLDGTTDGSGVFRSQWIKGLASGDYRADVVDMLLADYSWDPSLNLDDEETLTVF